MSVFKHKNGYYGYNFMYKSKRYCRTFKGLNSDEVANLETVHKAELIKTGYDITKKQVYHLYEIIKDYNLYKETKYTRPHEFDYVIDRFYKITSNKVAEDITLNDFIKYQNIRKSEVKASTVNREMDCIKRMFSLARQNRKIRFNPCEDIEDLRIENPEERFLTKAEEERLLYFANPIMRSMIIVAIYTGMRTGEILNLKWADVFCNENYLVALNTKNGKPRRLPMIEKVKNEILAQERISEYVFTSLATGTKYKDIKSTFARTVERADIPHITFHKLRHTTASRLNALGVDIVTIQRILDHCDLNITRLYTHTFDDSIINAFKKLSEY